MRKIIAILFTILFSISCLLQSTAAAESSNDKKASMSNFKKVKTYTPNTFTDVPKDRWYYSEIANAYFYGIVSGIGKNKFNPSGYMTIAEAIATATRINNIYKGGSGVIKPTTPGVWYSGNISYAESNGILAKGEFKGKYTKAATRSQLVHIYSKAVAAGEFPVKNDITLIPDLPTGSAYYNEIMTMYKAGVIVGLDAQGSFKPDAKITRAEAVAILNRIIDPDKRKSFTLVLPTAQNAFKQLMDTGKYVKGSGKIYGQGDCLFYKDAYPDLSDKGIQKHLKWYIFIDPNGGPIYDTENYECEIILADWNFDLTSRHQVRDALKILYPTGWEQVYDCMMKALNFELWEAGIMNTRNATSGTMWTRYADKRAINLQFQYDIGSVKIYIYKTEFKQSPPEQETEAGIKAETEVAKNFAGWKNIYKSCQLGTY